MNGRLALRALAMALALNAPAQAIERIRLNAAEVRAQGVTVGGLAIELRLLPDQQAAVAVKAARINLPAGQHELAGTLSAFEAQCPTAALRAPQFSCPALHLQATSSRWGRQTFSGKVLWLGDSGTLQADGRSVAPGEIPVALALHFDPTGLEVRASAADLPVARLAPQLQPFVALPAGLALQGKAEGEALLRARGESLQVEAKLRLVDAGFQNEDYTWIGEHLGLSLDASTDLSSTPWTFTIVARGTAGQALGGPVLLDFGRNPLQLQATGSTDGETLTLARFESRQDDLARITGTAHLRLDPFAVLSAEVDLPELHFPGIYAAFLQLPLATTPFNQLVTRGRAEATISVRDDAPTRVDLLVHELAFDDASRALEVTGVAAELHWRADVTDPRASFLAWESSRGWGITGARTRLDFTTSGRDFQLLRPARLPFFDGALVVNTLAAENIGTTRLSGVFDAVIEPISVAPIARALGWPEFQGQLSGRIPGLTYQDGVLSLQGNIEATVFDGTVVARNLRVSEPLGPWPRLFGNITGRNLDLDLITRTFEFGSITGRLDIDLLDLETFNWSPVAFDLKLATPPGDKSRHRISQRAVQNLSDIGGGGGGVAAALQSGALRFFDEFPYDRLGVSCRLRNDVCQMDGVGRSGTGFYLLKGKGLPRIDIIGNNRRVDWPLLVQQVRDALANPGALDVN